MKRSFPCRLVNRYLAFLLAAGLYLPVPIMGQSVTTVSVQVDLSVYRQLNLFRPDDGDLVFIRGNFNNYQLTHPLVGNPQTLVYTASFPVTLATNDTLRYEFFIFREENRQIRYDGWETDWINTNTSPGRWLLVTTNPVRQPLVPFAGMTSWSVLTLPQPMPVVTVYQEETKLVTVTLENKGTGSLDWVADPAVNGVSDSGSIRLLAVLQPGRFLSTYQLPDWWIKTQKTPAQVLIEDVDSATVLLLDESIREIEPDVLNHLISLSQAGKVGLVILTDRYPGWINLLTEPVGIVARPYSFVFSGQVKSAKRNQITADLEDFSVAGVLSYLDCSNAARPLITAKDGRCLGAIGSLSKGRFAVLSVHIPGQSAYCISGLAVKMIRWTAGDLPHQVAWEEDTGSLYPGGSDLLTLQIKPGLGKPGDYFEEVRVQSNDPVRPEVIVPVSFKVARKKVTPTLEKSLSIGQKSGAYPNPFNGETVIILPDDFGYTGRITVFDSAGRLVKTLLIQQNEQGPMARWNGTNSGGIPVASGVYFARAEGSGVSRTERLILIR